jgi:hypothetical protein
VATEQAETRAAFEGAHGLGRARARAGAGARIRVRGTTYGVAHRRARRCCQREGRGTAGIGGCRIGAVGDESAERCQLRPL